MAPTVNKPTDIKQKEADVNRKLQLYGIVSAFKSGKVPSVRICSRFARWGGQGVETANIGAERSNRRCIEQLS